MLHSQEEQEELEPQTVMQCNYSTFGEDRIIKITGDISKSIVFNCRNRKPVINITPIETPPFSASRNTRSYKFPNIVKRRRGTIPKGTLICSIQGTLQQINLEDTSREPQSAILVNVTRVSQT